MRFDQSSQVVSSSIKPTAEIQVAKTAEATGTQTGATVAAKTASTSDNDDGNNSNADSTLDPESIPVLSQDAQPAGVAAQLGASLSSDDTDSIPATAKRESKSSANSSTSTSAGAFATDATAIAPATAAATIPAIPTSTVVTGAVTGSIEVPQNAPSSHAAAANITRQNLPEEGPELSPGLRAWNSGENLQANLSGNPHLVEKLGQSEVNIALQGEGLGNVQVRAHLAGDQVGAAFTVDHHDVHAALTNDLPSLHQAFAERQLRVDHLSVQQNFSSNSSNSSGHTGTGDGRSQQQSQGSAQRSSAYDGSDSPFSSSLSSLTGGDLSETQGAFDSQGRLSVRA